MQIGCSRCEARYDIPEQKLGRGAVKVQCSRCGHLFVVRKRPPAAASASGDAQFEDFDFSTFQDEASGPAPLPRTDEKPASADLGFEDSEMAALDELDLGEFEGLGGDFEPGRGRPAAKEEHRAEEEPVEEEPVEQVRAEELVSIRSRDPQLQSSPEEAPRLNIQRGPRRSDSAMPSPVVARDRRRSPLFWVVLLAAVSTAGFTGYNIYRNPDQAFSFLSPSQIRKLWQQKTVEAEFGKEELKGYYRDFSAGRRLFVIQGLVVNRSATAQSLIRVEGQIYGREGRALASRSVYCGNVLTDRDLANLSSDTIDARLQNQMGDAFNNVDIAPGARVPFMVVFPSPPSGVEKFSVTVTEARVGSKS